MMLKIYKTDKLLKSDEKSKKIKCKFIKVKI